MAKESFLSSPKGKKIVGYAYGFGAAIVIVGALFKILHLPGASVVLTLGMGTEALLFALSAFEDPHKEYHLHDGHLRRCSSAASLLRRKAD